MSGPWHNERVRMKERAENTVFVLLLNWNGAHHTLPCLDSLERLTHARVRVIVCDNGSTDDSVLRLREWMRRHGELAEYGRAEAEGGGDAAHDARRFVLISVGDNLGFAGGNNVGLRYVLARAARSAAPPAPDYVWILNNDTVVAPESLERMLRVADGDAGIGCVGATLLEFDRPDVVQAAGGGRLVAWQGLPREHSASGAPRGSWEGTHPDRLDFVSMGCLLARLDVVRRIGLIDERFHIYCEDIDYSLRVRAAGLRLSFAPDAEVWHKGSASMIPGSPRHDYNMVRSSILLVRKFYPRLVPVAVAYSVVRCALPKVFRGQPVRLRAVVRGYRDALLHHESAQPESSLASGAT